MQKTDMSIRRVNDVDESSFLWSTSNASWIIPMKVDGLVGAGLPQQIKELAQEVWNFKT
jgi:hypothetical protein